MEGPGDSTGTKKPDSRVRGAERTRLASRTARQCSNNGPYTRSHCAGVPHKILIAFYRCFRSQPIRGATQPRIASPGPTNNGLTSNGNTEWESFFKLLHLLRLPFPRYHPSVSLSPSISPCVRLSRFERLNPRPVQSIQNKPRVVTVVTSIRASFFPVSFNALA